MKLFYYKTVSCKRAAPGIGQGIVPCQVFERISCSRRTCDGETP